MTDNTAPNAAPASPTNAPAATSPLESARAEISKLGTDAAFRAAYLDKSNPGHAAARERMDQLHQAAYPADENADNAQAAGPHGPLPLTFLPDTPGAQIVEAHKLANETAAALQVDPELARGAVGQLENAIRTRGPKPTPMNEAELNKFESILRERWGAEYDARTDAAHAALRKAGPRGGVWLQQAILHAGPAAAAWAFETLANTHRTQS